MFIKKNKLSYIYLFREVRRKKKEDKHIKLMLANHLNPKIITHGWAWGNEI